MKSNVYAIDGSSIETVELVEEVFQSKVNSQVIYEYVKLYLANQRLGTKNVKNRSEVKASTKKIYKQKGTGRARHGAVSAPQFVKGGKAFGPKPKSYYTKIRKGLKNISLVASLTDRAKKSSIKVVEDFKLDKISTKRVNEIIRAIVPEGTVLLVLDQHNEENKKIYLSARNLPYVDVKVAMDINSYDVIKNKTVLFTKSALQLFNISDNEVE